ncbi:hypothetical protein C8Q76DRAFT_113872 [Earliella scabrosa]|nr:hypothetical protein C8Q76DRAFT_113872 [Earliella scabrosa]
MKLPLSPTLTAAKKGRLMDKPGAQLVPVVTTRRPAQLRRPIQVIEQLRLRRRHSLLFAFEVDEVLGSSPPSGRMPPAIGVSSSLEDRLQRALEVAGCGTQSRGLRYVMNALWSSAQTFVTAVIRRRHHRARAPRRDFSRARGTWDQDGPHYILGRQPYSLSHACSSLSLPEDNLTDGLELLCNDSASWPHQERSLPICGSMPDQTRASERDRVLPAGAMYDAEEIARQIPGTGRRLEPRGRQSDQSLCPLRCLVMRSSAKIHDVVVLPYHRAHARGIDRIRG